MSRDVGLWIDHHKAVMVTIENDKEEIREIRSNVQKRIGISGGSTRKKPNLSPVSPAEGVADPKHGNGRNQYYDGVISMLANADSIRIFGPGEAKVEFKKRLEQGELGSRVISLETVNQMTDRQILAKLRDQFEN